MSCSASGVVELAPWLARGSNRIGIMHLSTGCKPLILRCAHRTASAAADAQRDTLQELRVATPPTTSEPSQSRPSCCLLALIGVWYAGSSWSAGRAQQSRGRAVSGSQRQGAPWPPCPPQHQQVRPTKSCIRTNGFVRAFRKKSCEPSSLQPQANACADLHGSWSPGANTGARSGSRLTRRHA